MAETVYLNDGTMECIFTDKDVFLERLLRERLGLDAARCFEGYISELKDELKYTEDASKENEKIADSYSAMCRDALEVFEQLMSAISEPRLNRKALQELITSGYKQLHDNL